MSTFKRVIVTLGILTALTTVADEGTGKSGIHGRTYGLGACGKAGGCPGANFEPEYFSTTVQIGRLPKCGGNSSHARGEKKMEIKSDAEGHFSIDLPPGCYSLHVVNSSFSAEAEVKAGQYATVSVRAGRKARRKR